MNSHSGNSNTLEIKYFDNIQHQLLERSDQLFENGGDKYRHELIEPSWKNHYEFYIDGTMLIKYIWGEDRYLWFLDNYVGVLGAWGKINNELLIRPFLMKKITEKDVRDIYSRSKEEQKESSIAAKLEHYNHPKILIYGCPVCASIDCGGIWITVTKDQNYYHWEITEDIKFKFEIKAYEKVFKEYLRHWKPAQEKHLVRI